MLEKETVVSFNNFDKRYRVIDKEGYGDFIKVSFQFEEEIYFGIIRKISSSGMYEVIVKGVVGKDSEEGLI